MRFETKNLLQLTLVVLVIVQISSWLLSEVTEIPMLRLGNAILLIVLASAMTILIGASFRFGKLRKQDILIFFVLVGVCVLAYVYLPEYFDIFSTLRPEVFSALSP